MAQGAAVNEALKQLNIDQTEVSNFRKIFIQGLLFQVISDAVSLSLDLEYI